MTLPSTPSPASPATTWSGRRIPMPRLAQIATLGFAAALLSACGGGGGAPSDNNGSTPALTASKPGDLTSYVQRVLRERAVQRQAGQSFGDARTVSPLPVGAAAPATGAGTAFSTSLNQEAGVDEPDFVKTDGTLLLNLDLQDGARPLVRLSRREASGVLTDRAALALSFGGATALLPRGLLLAGDSSALGVVSDGWAGLAGGNPCADICPTPLLPPGPTWVRSLVAVERVAVADGSARPLLPTARLEFDGRLIDARRIGERIVLVSEYQPMLAADQLPADAPIADRESAIAATRGEHLLPRRRLASGDSEPLLAETDCWVQPANASLTVAVTTITVLDLRAADLAPASRCFVGGAEALYMTTRSLYVASTRWSYPTASGGAPLRYSPAMRTDIHKFAFDAEARLAYRGSGEVEGHLGWDAQRKSYRLGEHEGVLRVLTFTGSLGWATAADAAGVPPSPATLTALRESTSGEAKLEAIATLPNAKRPQALGKPGEQVHGVRFAGARGYLVTFRQIDPLYVLDLADAIDPKVAGVLETPGFSDHLLPLSAKLLLGVGKEVDSSTGRTGGVKVSLFDVADATRPRELASRVFGAVGSQSGLDASRQGLALLQQGTVMRVATPLFLFDPGFVNARDGLQRLEVDLEAGTLASKAIVAPADAGLSPGNLAAQRSVMIGAQIYWLRGGRLSRHEW